MENFTVLALYSPGRSSFQPFDQTGGNFPGRASELGCPRNTLKKFVRGHEMHLPLEYVSRRSQRSPHQTSREAEELAVKEREATDVGLLKLAYHIRKKHGLMIPSFTIRNIVRDHELTRPERRRGKFRSLFHYDWDKIYPLQHFQIDLKVIRDRKNLPWSPYQHVQKCKLPFYEWTGIDPQNYAWVPRLPLILKSI